MPAEYRTSKAVCKSRESVCGHQRNVKMGSHNPDLLKHERIHPPHNLHLAHYNILPSLNPGDLQWDPKIADCVTKDWVEVNLLGKFNSETYLESPGTPCTFLSPNWASLLFHPSRKFLVIRSTWLYARSQLRQAYRIKIYAPTWLDVPKIMWKQSVHQVWYALSRWRTINESLLLEKMTTYRWSYFHNRAELW